MTQIWSNVNIGPHVHTAADITSGTIAAGRLPNLAGLLHNVTATVPPTSAADSSAGYAVGSVWHDRTSDVLWQCASASVGAAVWAPLNQQLAVAVSGQRAREVVAAGGSLVLSEEQTLTGAQSPAVQTTVPLAVAAGGTLSFRVHQTAGSARVIPWAVISL